MLDKFYKTLGMRKIEIVQNKKKKTRKGNYQIKQKAHPGSPQFKTFAYIVAVWNSRHMCFSKEPVMVMSFPGWSTNTFHQGKLST